MPRSWTRFSPPLSNSASVDPQSNNFADIRTDQNGYVTEDAFGVDIPKDPGEGWCQRKLDTMSSTSRPSKMTAVEAAAALTNGAEEGAKSTMDALREWNQLWSDGSPSGEDDFTPTTTGRLDSEEYRLKIPATPDGQLLDDAPYVCCFCLKKADSDNVGELYGPFFVQPSSPAFSLFFDGLSRSRVKPSGISNTVAESNSALFADVWFHANCALWAPGILLRNGEIIGLQEQLPEFWQQVWCLGWAGAELWAFVLSDMQTMSKGRCEYSMRLWTMSSAFSSSLCA